ncbi:hypothetical protein RHP47_07040 [Thermosynechococcus sp. QKsg1]|uniref:hypothetical protein n=1 Tax=unclassified Thermosynechococcus TaxID=2622553 RepID=UPI0025765CF8|nr:MULTISPECIES: hypothetical protein [unclassified Thermosynechococcus]WJI28031.1 hypothetical protein M0646_07115 [Thermosynechococcus sp. B3]WNC85601.1 hypothetical protein RHP47_07040 [Thermosynechococcus sp. QKsg1]
MSEEQVPPTTTEEPVAAAESSTPEPLGETVSAEEVIEAAKELLAALQRFAAAQLKALPADVQKALETAIAELKSNADTVSSHVKDFEERLKAAWEVLTAKKELPSGGDGES